MSTRKVPLEAARGGANTLYPEYSARLRELAANPARVTSADSPACGGNRCVAPLRDDGSDVRVTKVQGRVYMISGAGGNIAAQVGDDGVVLVNAGTGTATDKVLMAVRGLTEKPIRFILNTSADPENIGGNEALAKAGASGGRGQVAGASVIAHEAVIRALSAAKGKNLPLSSLSAGSWPTITFAGELKDVQTNDEAIQMFHQSAAHGAGDSVVFFRGSDVVVTGDVVDITRFPVIDAAQGGTFRGVLAAVNRIIDITVPHDWQEGGTLVIPAHGQLADESDLVEYRDMLTIVRDRIQDLIKKGMTLQQVLAARPTFEYDGLYGATSGPWTTAMFVGSLPRLEPAVGTIMRPLEALGTSVRAAAVAALVVWSGSAVMAQRGRGAAPVSGGNPKAAGPIDLTGTWVSVVSEDWLQRMLMPPRGDYAGVPLTLEGRTVANMWEPASVATDGCKPFGAPAVMRIPGRLQISWENDTTLKILTDAGLQTRLLHFDQPKAPVAERTWQGYSQAEWEQLTQRGGHGAGLAPPAPRAGAALKVTTTKLRAGYLRRNGVPYSEQAVLTEYFDRRDDVRAHRKDQGRADRNGDNEAVEPEPNADDYHQGDHGYRCRVRAHRAVQQTVTLREGAKERLWPNAGH